MEATREELSAQIGELTRAVADIQQRLMALERLAGVAQNREPVRAESFAAEEPGRTAVEPARTTAGSIAPLFGWAFLGLAGAYLLRGITESGSLPGAFGAGAGILYAGVWLFMAARKAGGNPLGSAVHGATAALILAPMLWEVTTRLNLIGARTASAVLILFSIWGLAIAWRQKITAIAWTATMCGIVTAAALFRETHDIPSWMVTTLIIAATVEFSACRDHWLGLRWIVAFFADVNIAALCFVMVRPGDPGAPVGWAIGSQLALVAIYVASTLDRSVLRKLRIDWFEIAQPVVAFLILTGGALKMASNWPTAPVLAGVTCVAVGLGCYAVAMTIGEPERRRNFFAYSTGALGLCTAGFWLVSSGAPLAAVLAVLAAAALVIGAAWERVELRIHGVFYLLLATLAAGYWGSAYESIVRSASSLAPIGPGYAVVALASAACCAAAWRVKTRQWVDRYAATICGGLLLWGIAGMAAHGVPSSFVFSAPVRTGLLIALAAGSSWAGRRFGHEELVWLVYPLLAAAGVKLLVEDLRAGRSLTMFLSLILFGGALLLLPKLVRQPEPSKATAATG